MSARQPSGRTSMVVSDTNILGSFAAADALPQLIALLEERTILIPPAVEDELRTGVARGAEHLQRVLLALDQGHITVVSLGEADQAFARTLPRKLNAGEREAIALALRHNAGLLTNDQQAIRSCGHVGIPTLDLKALLRELWLRRVATQTEVRGLIEEMSRVDRTVFLERDLNQIFAPRRRKR